MVWSPSFDGFLRLRPSCATTQSAIDEMVAFAKPRALAVLGPRGAEVMVDGELPVYGEIIPVSRGQFGQLMSAWPAVEARPIPIYVLENWGFFLYLLRTKIGEPDGQADAVDSLFANGSRIRVGVTNDVLQGFVIDPPKGMYRMCRHHGFMLMTATLWLDTALAHRWFQAYTWSAQSFIRQFDLKRMSDPIAWLDDAERQVFQIFRTIGPSTGDDDGCRTFLENRPVLDALEPYFGGSSLAIAALYREYRDVPSEGRSAWYIDTALRRHADPRFNAAQIERFLDTVQ